MREIESGAVGISGIGGGAIVDDDRAGGARSGGNECAARRPLHRVDAVGGRVRVGQELQRPADLLGVGAIADRDAAAHDAEIEVHPGVVGDRVR